jgi:DNA mismatch repair ATPase MutS
MFLDSATLQDLEIVPTSNRRGLTLWSFLDRTQSRIGREALRQRLKTPARSADQILALQLAHRAIASYSGLFRRLLDAADLDGVDDYLNVTWQLPIDMGRLLWRRKWYREYLNDVESGQVRVRALITAASELSRQLSATDAAVLRAVAEQITTLLSQAEMLDLLRAATYKSSRGKRQFDQLARDGAKHSLTAVLNCIGKVEAMWSLAAATAEHGWSYPRPASRLAAVGLFHPFLGQQAVRNDLDLDERVHVCFVTGPNMAGKTTFLKAVALAVLLGHLGCGVPATSLDFPPVGSIFSSVDIVDNLSAGESFYLAEVRRIRDLALALSEHGSTLAVVDEPFRGTNVHDAAEATLATITRLAAHPAALVLIASHVGEVVPAIRDDPKIRLFQFSAEISAGQPDFDYKLRPGVSVQRLGMTLLRQERVFEILESSTQSAEANAHPALPATIADLRDNGGRD